MDVTEFTEHEEVLVVLSDGRTTVTERAAFVKRIKDGITMNGTKEDASLVIPEGCTETVVVRYACLRKRRP